MRKLFYKKTRTALHVVMLTLLFAFQAKAQCPPGNVVLNTQAEVDQFIIDYPNCTEINGYIAISANVTNLDGLSNITTITNSIDAENATSLSDISGLSNLTSVGKDIFIRNTALTNLNGFNNLTSVAGWIEISSNTSLTNLNGLSALTSVGGHLAFISNTSLTNLNGLSALTSVGGFIYIQENAILSDISALQNTTFNPNGSYGLTIKNNPALAVCNLPNFCAYLANPASTHPRDISGNLANCLDEAAVVAACNTPATGCTNVTSTFLQFPSETYIPQCTSSPEDITGNYAETGEYSKVQVTATVEYTFSSSVATDYITISNEDGTVVYAHGYSPLVWTAPANEIVRFFLHLDDACNTNNDPDNWRSRLIQCNSLSISDINTNTISFYPNPVKETLYFSEEVSTIKITDLAGRTVKQYTSKSTSVDVSELSKGTYILSATTQDGKTFTKKIIKE